MVDKASAKNAKITSTTMGTEDHGIMTLWLILDYGGGGQGFGGHALDEWSPADGRRVGTAYGMEFIARVLDVVGVDSWEKLPGKHIRVVADRIKVSSIGHIIEDKWFTPDEDMASFLMGDNGDGNG